MCYGEGDTGKTRVIMALKALAGAEWTCSIGVEHMDDPVKMVAIEHMRLNVITELSAAAMIRDGGFKTLVGTQEPIFLNPKYQRPRMYVPLAKHAIACNSLPDVNDRTMATFNRLLLIPFSNVIEKHHQDPALDDKLGAEIEGIFTWAVEGAKRLIENRGQFTEVGEAKELIANYRAEANPIVGFMDEEMVKEADAVAPLIDIVKCFNEKRYGRPVDARRVSKWLRAHLGEGCVRPARIGEKTARCLIGWRLRGDFRSE